MKSLRALLLALFTAAALFLTAGAAGAHAPNHHNNVCSSGNVASGSYRNLTIKGTCAIPDGAVVTVTGHVFLSSGATLNAMTASTVQIKGSVFVAQGATLSLGCSFALTQPPFPGGPVFCTGVSHDAVGGSIIATAPKTLKVDGITVGRDLISVGGGVAVTGANASTCESHPGALNFPIKDNTINGNVLISGWQGCWMGFIRNVQHGNTAIIANRTGDADSTEIVTNTISGNLLCWANTPAPQLGDSHGTPNTVAGHKVGQCAAL